MDPRLRDQINRPSEELGQAIFEIEQVEAEPSAGCEFVQQIDVAVGGCIASSS